VSNNLLIAPTAISIPILDAMVEATIEVLVGLRIMEAQPKKLILILLKHNPARPTLVIITLMKFTEFLNKLSMH
jgi:uncharacterized protein YqfA (UPF0365 family)